MAHIARIVTLLRKARRFSSEKKCALGKTRLVARNETRGLDGGSLIIKRKYLKKTICPFDEADGILLLTLQDYSVPLPVSRGLFVEF